MKQLTNKIFKDTFIVMISNIINYAGMFILAVMVTRLLGVQALGEFTYIFAISPVLSIISEFGLSQLSIRKINSDRSYVFSLVKNINIFKLFLSVICVIASGLILSIIPSSGFNMTFAAGILIIIPKVFQTTYESAIRALMKQTLPSVFKSINSLIQIVLAYLILIKTGNLLAMFVMILIMETLTAFVFRIAATRVWQNLGIPVLPASPISFSYIKPIIKEALPFFGSNFLALSMPKITIIILGNLLSQVSLGIFSAASRFANGIGLVSGAIYNTFYPVMTDPNTPLEKQYSLAKKFALFAFLAGLVISLTIYFSAGLLIDLTFKIPQAVPVLELMALMVIPILVYSVIQPFLFAIHAEKFILKTYIAVWSFNIFCSVYLINLYGYIGAAISTIITEYLILLSLLFKFFNTKTRTL